MRGNVPQIKDIILNLEPQPEIDLQCYEEFDNSEEEEDEVDNMRDQLERRAGQAGLYTIEAPCCRCLNVVQLSVESSHQNLLIFEQLLMGDLNLICPRCANN